MGKIVMKVVGVRMGRYVIILSGFVRVSLGGEVGSVIDVSIDELMSDYCKSFVLNIKC